MNIKQVPFYLSFLFSSHLMADVVSGNFIVSTDFIKTVCDVSVSGGSGSGGQVIDGTGTAVTAPVIDLGIFSINNDFNNSNTTDLQDVVLSFTNCPDTDVNFTILGKQTSEDDTIFVMEGDNAAILGLVIQYGQTMLENTAKQQFNTPTVDPTTGIGTATLNVGYKIFGSTTSFVQEVGAQTLVTLTMIYGS